MKCIMRVLSSLWLILPALFFLGSIHVFAAHPCEILRATTNEIDNHYRVRNILAFQTPPIIVNEKQLDQAIGLGQLYLAKDHYDTYPFVEGFMVVNSLRDNDTVYIDYLMLHPERADKKIALNFVRSVILRLERGQFGRSKSSVKMEVDVTDTKLVEFLKGLGFLVQNPQPGQQRVYATYHTGHWPPPHLIPKNDPEQVVIGAFKFREFPPIQKILSD